MSPSSSSCCPSTSNSIYHFMNPNPVLSPVLPKTLHFHSIRNGVRLSIPLLQLTAASGSRRSPATSSSSSPPLNGHVLRDLAVASVLLLGLGFGRHRCFSASAAVDIPSPPPVAASVDFEFRDNDDMGRLENLEDAKAAEVKAAFEKWKSKTYALTVPLRIVALRNSLPAVWFKDFIQSQGKRVKLQPEYRQSLKDIFFELCMPLREGAVNLKSAVTADIVTLGDSWLSFAIKEGLIDPIQGVEDQDWFQNLTDKWKGYLRRSSDGKLDPQGQIWAAPYRWGSLVIAYKRSKFQNYKLAPIEDWADLWHPELAGKISMVDSPREIVGAVLKYMGASYNTHDINSQVAGGKAALLEKLTLLAQQVRLFDSHYYLKAFGVGDVWVAVGWSSDILPAAKRMSNVTVVVPKSGASLWADLWAIPCTSRIKTNKVGGRVRGPSPLLSQWIEFCLQSARRLSFKEEAVPGASPVALENPGKELDSLNKGRPKLETNLVAGIPPPDILARCEFLEPLPDDTLADYQWLIDSINKKPKLSVIKKLQHCIFLVLDPFLPKLQSKVR